MTSNFITFETDIGWMGIAGTPAGINKIILPMQDRESIIKTIANAEYSEESYLLETKNALIKYFKGKQVNFQIPLDLSGYTEFQKSVWNVAKNIPYGELRSYKWVATQIGNTKAVRAVGNALGKNPIPIIIPCHRVIGSDGKLHGFTGGLDWKKKLIELETKHHVR
ncbi:TPA: methylated-DNA--[protein]-cysteine S-methyltransferase [bacterium]|nr:methylated-DNA--[protein]-cysteine S-methyltransferase [bacterium]